MLSKPTTPAEAAARHKSLLADREWTARYLKGGAAERAEISDLHRTMVGEPPAAQSAPEQAAARHKSLLADREWAARYLKGGAAERAELDELHHLIAGQEGGS